jgi:hypothetical protein
LRAPPWPRPGTSKRLETAAGKGDAATRAVVGAYDARVAGRIPPRRKRRAGSGRLTCVLAHEVSPTKGGHHGSIERPAEGAGERGAGQGPGHRRAAAGPGHRNLRPGILGQDDPGPACRGRGPAPGGIAAFIDAEHALDTVPTPRNWGSTATICWSPSPIPASRPWRSPTCWSAAAPSTCWSSTRWRPWCPGPRSRARWAIPTWVCRPG